MLKKFFKSYIMTLNCALFLAALLLPPCLKADDQNEKFDIKPLYIFQNSGGRDPFSPRYKEETFPTVVAVDITTLALLGITESNNVKTALFKSKIGSNFGYIFTGGRMYGDNDEIISDIAGEFKSDMEVLLRQGDREVLFKLTTNPAGSPNIKGGDQGAARKTTPAANNQ
jgi:hypothetical protein